jgi:hypothetical protein
MMIEEKGFPRITGPEAPVASEKGLIGVEFPTSHISTESFQIRVVAQGRDGPALLVDPPGHEDQPGILLWSTRRPPAILKVILMQANLQGVAGKILQESLGHVPQEIHSGGTVMGVVQDRPG